MISKYREKYNNNQLSAFERGMYECMKEKIDELAEELHKETIHRISDVQQLTLENNVIKAKLYEAEEIMGKVEGKLATVIADYKEKYSII